METESGKIFLREESLDNLLILIDSWETVGYEMASGIYKPPLVNNNYSVTMIKKED